MNASVGAVPAQEPDRREPPLTALLRLASQGRSGILTVKGRANGTIHFRGPSLLRVDVPELPALPVDEKVLAGPGAAGTVARLRVFADRLFVLEHAWVGNVVHDERENEDGEFTLPDDGTAVSVDRLVREVARRDRALSALPVRVEPLHDRVAGLRSSRWTRERLVGPDLELLDAANGRRTSLDLANALGRGVYGTTVDVARLVAAGVLELRPRARARGSLATATPAGTAQPAGTAEPVSAAEPVRPVRPDAAASLPRAPLVPSPGTVLIPHTPPVPAALPVREPAARLPALVGGPQQPQARVEPVDAGVLRRVLTALRRL